MKNTRSHSSALTSRCDFLGLKDDPQTCLAFSSNWNYCHRARPPESVRIEHQRQYCHTPDHVQCPIYRNERPGPLPPEVRGRRMAKTGRAKQAARIPALLFILIPALLILWLAQTPSLLNEIKSGLFRKTNTGSQPPVTVPVTSTAAATKTKTPGSFIPPAPSPVSIQTNFSTPADYSAGTPVVQTPTSPFEGVCGYPLDTPFGKEHQFIIHQAQDGDSLSMYANYYQTSVDAIRALNYRLPVPLLKEWVVVILVGETQAGDLPSFETYLASNTGSSIESLARELSTDPAALKQYNDFDESCRAFSGWLLIPRQKPAP